MGQAASPPAAMPPSTASGALAVTTVTTPSTSGPLSSSRAAADPPAVEAAELYLCVLHFLKNSPCQAAAEALEQEARSHCLLPRRYALQSDEAGAAGSHELSYDDLRQRYPHLRGDHVQRLLQELLATYTSAFRNTPAAGISTILGSGTFSLLRGKHDYEREKAAQQRPSVLSYLHYPHRKANIMQALGLRELGFNARHKSATAPGIWQGLFAPPQITSQRINQLRKFRGHQNAVYCAIFDRRGLRIVTGSDDRLVKIWSAVTGLLLFSCRGHTGDITDLSISPDSQHVASSSNDHSIRVWWLHNGVPAAVCLGHTLPVTAISFCSAHPIYRLFSCSDDGTCRLWNLNDTTKPLVLQPLQPQPAVPLPQPVTVVVDDEDEPVQTAPAARAAKPLPQVLCCALDASGHYFVTGGTDCHARVWYVGRTSDAGLNTRQTPLLQTGQEIAVLKGHRNDVNYVQFSHHSENLVTASRDGSARIWVRARHDRPLVKSKWKCLRTLTPITTIPRSAGPMRRPPPVPTVNMSIWSLDDQYILAAMSDFSIRVWSAMEGVLLHTLQGHKDQVFVLESSPVDARIALSAGYDGLAILWDVQAGHKIREFKCEASPQDVGSGIPEPYKLVDGHFSPDGMSFVLSDEVGQIFIYSTGTARSMAHAQYDQFFSSDYMDLIRDVHGNVLDAQTNQPPHIRQQHDLLVDVWGVPYADEYQQAYQSRRLQLEGLPMITPPSPMSPGTAERDAAERLLLVNSFQQSDLQASVDVTPIDQVASDDGADSEDYNAEVDAEDDDDVDTERRSASSDSNRSELSASSSSAHEDDTPACRLTRNRAAQVSASMSLRPRRLLKRKRVRDQPQTARASKKQSQRSQRRQARSEGRMHTRVRTAVNYAELNGDVGLTPDHEADTRATRSRRRQSQEDASPISSAQKDLTLRRSRRNRDAHKAEEMEAGPSHRTVHASVSGRDHRKARQYLDFTENSASDLEDQEDLEVDEQSAEDEDADGVVTQDPNEDDGVRRTRSQAGLATRRPAGPFSSQPSRLIRTDKGKGKMPDPPDTRPKGSKSKRPAARQRKVRVSEVENERPAAAYEWLLSDGKLRNQYVPQLGDQVFYFRQGHELWLASSRDNLERPPSETIGDLRPVEHCKVTKLKYVLSKMGDDTAACQLTLMLLDTTSPFHKRTFTLELPHDTKEFADFIVEHNRYVAAQKRGFKVGDTCWSLWVNEGTQKWYKSTITQESPFDSRWPDSPWDRFSVKYHEELHYSETDQSSPADAELESGRLCCWDMYTYQRERWEPPRLSDNAVSVLQATIEDIYEEAEYYGVGGKQDWFREVVRPKQLPGYLSKVAVPMALKVIEARLKNNYYRQLDAVKHDIEQILKNAELFHENGGIVSVARKLVRRLLQGAGAAS
eukprot:jgi/Chlat1/6956/Chrsp52S06626